MYGMVKSELMKMRHTFSMKLVFFAPLATLLLGYILSGSYVQLSAYNWWYTIILPVLVSMLSASMIVRERNTGMQNILCLPVSSSKIWLGKIMALILLVLGANLLLWLATTAAGFAASMEVSPLNGLIGCILLALTFVWQIPLVMLLTSLMGYFPALILSVGANLLLSTIGAEKKKLVLSGPICNSGTGSLSVFWNASQWSPVRKWFLFAGWGRCCSGRSDWPDFVGSDDLGRLPSFWEGCAEI